LQELSEEKHQQAMENEYNFDSPDAFDTDCIENTLRRLKEGKKVEIPVYNFTTHRSEKKKVLCHFYSYAYIRSRCNSAVKTMNYQARQLVCRHVSSRDIWPNSLSILVKADLIGRNTTSSGNQKCMTLIFLV